MGAQSDTPVTDPMGEARGMMAVNPAIAPQMRQFWKAQDGILDDAEAFSKAWFERRHEATRSALDAVHRINGDGASPSTAMQAVADWQHGAVRRLAEDMRQWVELWTACAGRMTEAELEAGKEGAENVARRTKSAARTRHATPV